MKYRKVMTYYVTTFYSARDHLSLWHWIYGKDPGVAHQKGKARSNCERGSRFVLENIGSECLQGYGRLSNRPNELTVP